MSIWMIRRSATDAKLTGLCGGVARYWGVDPVLVRVGAVLLAFSGGIGIVLYLAGWLLIPVDGRETSTLDDLLGSSSRKWPREAWVAVVIVACVLTFAIFGAAMPFGFGPAIVLALLWYFGYYKNRSGRGRAPSPRSSSPPPPVRGVPGPAVEPFRNPGPATPFTQAADAWRQRMEEMARQSTDYPPIPTGPTAYAASPAPSPVSSPAAFPVSSPAPTPSTFPLYADAASETDPRLSDPPAVDEKQAFLATPDPVGLYSEPAQQLAEAPSRAIQARSRTARRLRLMAILVLGITLAGLGIADVSGATIPVAVYVGAALLVVGLTLVAATWFGRARGILPVGLVLLLVLLSVTVAETPDQQGGWNRTVSYTTLASLPRGGDQQEFGTLKVDLSQLKVPHSSTYSARVDAGRIEVIAPTGVDVRVRYAIDAGVVIENGEPVRSGTDMVGVLEPVLPQSGRPTLTLDLAADLGEIRIQR